jgi:glucose-1-phosphate cytidylyltransferase
MKVVILAGGLGSRISEETHLRPKPMIEIGGKPILWHIMKIYSVFNHTDFVICCGYKGYMIKEYFANYFLHTSDVTFDIENNRMEVHERYSEPWRVTLVDTGEDTLTAGRLRRVAKYVRDEEAFFFTYGDGVADLDMERQLAFHRQHGKLATLTSVLAPGRYGALEVEGGAVTAFIEKPRGDGARINGGFSSCRPR